MDVETVDREYQQLEQEAQQLATAIQQLAEKMQGASGQGDSQAREWLLDLKSIALQIQQEQLQVQALLQALHGFTVNNLPGPQQQYAPAPQQYVSAPQANYGPPGGGVMSRFRGGGFGQAMSQGLGMGAGFGLADSVINAIFNR